MPTDTPYFLARLTRLELIMNAQSMTARSLGPSDAHTTANSQSIAPKLYSIHQRLFRILRTATWPTVDLLIRLWLGQIFFISGILKLTHWDTALNLAATEYPVSWMNPVTAAYTGVSIEVLGGALLALGFMTRYAAIPMLILSLVIQFNYHAYDNQLFWTVLFGWYAVQGSGSFSLDSLLRKGLADSALPLIPKLLRFTERVRTHFGSVYL